MRRLGSEIVSGVDVVVVDKRRDGGYLSQLTVLAFHLKILRCASHHGLGLRLSF